MKFLTSYISPDAKVQGREVELGREVIVVGAGEVFRRRYIIGNRHLPRNRRLRFAHLVDVIPEQELRALVSPADVGCEFEGYQLQAPFESSLRRLISQPQLRHLPVLIAAPTPYHVPYAEEALLEGRLVAVEKPIAASLQQVKKFRTLLQQYGTERMFLFAYYYLEKGLPLVVWARAGRVDPFVASLVTFESSLPNWEEARQALGKVLAIYGVLLEGIGPAGQLDQRPWTLVPENGGNTVETFYHLVCLVDAVLGSESHISIQQVRLARHSETARALAERGMRNIAETLTWASMRTESGTEIELLAAKYVPEALHQRWFFITCERGILEMDLESQRLEVRANGQLLSSTLRWPQKYATQFMLLTEKLDRPNLPIEEEPLLRALARTLDIRVLGLRKGIGSYREDDVETDYMTTELARRSCNERAYMHRKKGGVGGQPVIT